MDYADTLKEWRTRFESKEAEIQRLGFSDEFQRMWRFYLAYCEAGFRSGDLNVSQFTLGAN
jgi:cyclopropane-fatty-acyl-phospholipid synthase